MKKKLSILICAALAVMLAASSFAGCGKKKVSNEKTAFVISSDVMDGVFNPFFATSGPDNEVLGMVEVGMFNSDDEGNLAYGENEPTVVLDYNREFVEGNAQNKLGKLENGKYTGQTTYTLILKNGLKFSDGKPLTYRDVLFNMYVYLDPVYTGSSTMYSTDIVGLTEYRTQKRGVTEESQENVATDQAYTTLTNVISKVTQLTNDKKDKEHSEYHYAEKKENDELRKDLVAKFGEGETKKQEDDIVKIYDRIKELFVQEVKDDYKGAIEAYKDEPYKMTDVQGFLYNEGYIVWDKKENKMKNADDYAHITTEEQAIQYVINANMPMHFDEIATGWGTANKILTELIAEAREKNLGDNSAYPNISGITVLDGATTPTVTSIEENGHQSKTYNVASASDYNADYSIKDSNKYQVIQIKINGQDPKAIWNFSFSVAPMHYYSTPELVAAFDGVKNFGVKYSSLDFMNNVIKGGDKVGLPVGAGPYKATDENDSANPTLSGFFNDNKVYFIRNEHFMMGPAKIKHVRYQVINQSQSVNQVRNGKVHYSTPQATTANMKDINDNKKNIDYVKNQQLGYGYIGINAGKIPDSNLRKAIISAFNTELCMQYYTTYAEKLAWPMSKASWAYPSIDGKPVDEFSYGEWVDDKTAQQRVLSCMNEVKTGLSARKKIGTTGELDQYDAVKYNGKPLKFTFTIAGANLTEHPTYNTFKKAAEILNACGWDIEVRADNYTLTKLSTGALDVWAAAWSTTVDPDMYQVYHRLSKATSVLNWGYREMKSGQASNGLGAGTLTTDWGKVKKLSDNIEAARKITDQKQRADIYAECLRQIMDLAVEFPTYQRDNIYLYNSSIVDGSTLHESKSAFASPLSRIWEVGLKEN